jgi:hypothetical protein
MPGEPVARGLILLAILLHQLLCETLRLLLPTGCQSFDGNLLLRFTS